MNNSDQARLQSPRSKKVDLAALQEFENGLDMFAPEKSAIPCQVLGYGEISTVFKILDPRLASLAFKRMSIFESLDELDPYLAAFEEYQRILAEEIGLRLPDNGYAAFLNRTGRPVFYIIQQELDRDAIGSRSLQTLPKGDILTLFQRALEELTRVWSHNQQHPEKVIGIDGQISNWVMQGYSPGATPLPPDIPLMYIDTSTPLLRLDGQEQMNPELFLRPAPSFLAWILRLLFLEEVVDRYYDFRKVAIDLLANCFKEGKPELVPDLVSLTNRYFAQHQPALEPIQEKELVDYYREDALIWTLYLAMRRFDRFLHRYLLRRTYPYLLPGRIRR